MEFTAQRTLDQTHQIRSGFADATGRAASPRLIQHRLAIIGLEFVQRNAHSLLLLWAQMQCSGPLQTRLFHTGAHVLYSTNTCF